MVQGLGMVANAIQDDQHTNDMHALSDNHTCSWVPILTICGSSIVLEHTIAPQNTLELFQSSGGDAKDLCIQNILAVIMVELTRLIHKHIENRHAKFYHVTASSMSCKFGFRFPISIAHKQVVSKRGTRYETSTRRYRRI